MVVELANVGMVQFLHAGDFSLDGFLLAAVVKLVFWVDFDGVSLLRYLVLG